MNETLKGSNMSVYLSKIHKTMDHIVEIECRFHKRELSNSRNFCGNKKQFKEKLNYVLLFSRKLLDFDKSSGYTLIRQFVHLNEFLKC